MPVEAVPDPGSAADDAGLAVAGEQHAQAADFQVEGAFLGAAGQGVPDEGDVELAALKTVCGVDGDAGKVRVLAVEVFADGGPLVDVRDTDRYAGRGELCLLPTRGYFGPPEPHADKIREVASVSAPVGHTPLRTEWSEWATTTRKSCSLAPSQVPASGTDAYCRA